MVEEQISLGIVAEVNIKDFPISTRTRNILIDNGFITLSSIQNLYLDDLKNIDGLGDKGITEIRDYVGSKFKIYFKRKPKLKKTKDFSEAKEVVLHLLGNKVDDWARQIKVADKLISIYGKETLMRVKPNDKVYSLVWYLNDTYGYEYIKKFIPVQLIKEKEIPKETCDPIEFKPVFNKKPKNIKEFLNVR